MTHQIASGGDQDDDSTIDFSPNLDDVDKQILSDLLAEARHTTCPDIAQNLSVTPVTVRNRIDKLETNGVIDGYQAVINYKTLGLFSVLFVCTARPNKRKQVAESISELSAISQTRELLSGSHNLHVVAVVSGPDHIEQVEHQLSELPLSIEHISLIGTERKDQYTGFSSTESSANENK